MEKPIEEIMFQVKINREEKSFEFVKTELNNFEQVAFENFLQNYLDKNKELRKDNFESEYFEKEEFKE